MQGNTNERGRLEFRFAAPYPTWLRNGEHVNFPGGNVADPEIGLDVETWKQGHDTSFWVTVHFRGERSAIYPIGWQELGSNGPDIIVTIDWTPEHITIGINDRRKIFTRARL